MRSWKGECSRAFTDWRGLPEGVINGAWPLEDARVDVRTEAWTSL